MLNQSRILLEQYATEYQKSVYYYCLKRTGNPEEAEDLSSDITIQIVDRIYAGDQPNNFSAWIWTIVKNRYSVWAKKKRRTSENVHVTPIDDFDVPSVLSLAEEMEKSESLTLLRRELAFISTEYRQIIVAYYMEDMRIGTIADMMGLPAGTIKRKLFESRKKSKEGMNMAREFGAKSYNPEDVNFGSTGSQPSGLPWSAVGRKIPKNILLEAHNNPSTLEELAIALGVAHPYIEEEVQLLLDATLLTQTEQKYLTNFFIADKECQHNSYAMHRSNSKARSQKLDQLAKDMISVLREVNAVRNDMNDDGLKWFTLIYSIDYILTILPDYTLDHRVERNDGGDWGFMGFEQNTITEATELNHNMNGNDSGMFAAYNIGPYNSPLWLRPVMNYHQTILLTDMILHNRKATDLSGSEMNIWKEINNRYAHTLEDGTIIPDILVFTHATLKRYQEVMHQHPLFQELYHEYTQLSKDTRDLLKRNSNKVLHKQLDYCTSMLMFDCRMMAVNDEVEAGNLIIPQNPEKSTIAMYLTTE